MSNVKKFFGVLVAFAMLSAVNSMGSLATDYSGNYSAGWTNGSNGGSGFGAWGFTPTGNAGTFIGNPVSAGIGGMGTEGFGLYANPAAANNIDVSRPFASALTVGDTFSIDWGVNWDSDVSGNKGLSLYAGAIELVNINMAGSQVITVNGSTMFANYGTNTMTLNFSYLGDTSLRVFATGRDGSETYNQTLVVGSGAPTYFKLYANNLPASAPLREPYFNNMTVIPEPTTAALFGFIALGFLAVRRFKR